jgi:hypothetical protein
MQNGQHAAQVVPINQKNAASVSDRAKLARLPAPAHQVRERGKQILQKSLHKVFDEADDALFTLADKATNNHEQNLFFESMREVRIRRRHMEAKFETAIDEAFVRLLSEKDEPEPSDRYLADQDISFDDLSLVQNDDLEELVAVDSMVNKANTACGENLQYLSLRLDSLVPTKVYQKNNPLGPQVICQSFIDTAKDLDADIKAKLVLFKLFDKHVVSQLPAFLESLNQILIDQGVLPTIQNPRKANSGTGQGGRTAVSQKPLEQMTREETMAAAEDTLNALRGLMHGQLPQGPVSGHSGSAQPSGGIYAGGSVSGGGQAGTGQQGGSGPVAVLRNDELLGALSQLQNQQQSQWSQHAPTSVAGVRTDVNAYISQLYQGQGSPRQVGPIESDVINLVKMLFEFILDDRNLAAPLKALIGRLQIPILKVALLDKTFFSKAGHPARRLLNEMATAALGWQDDSDDDGEPTDPLYKKMHSIVHTLLSDFETEVGIFTDMLTDFVAFIDRERRRASVLERRTLDAEDGKAKAEAARKKVAAAIEAKVEGKSIPAPVQKILNDAWSNVLFLLCLRKGTDSPDWNNALKTAEELVWSVTVEIDTETRSQLLALIPRIVKHLREGLEKISFNPFEMTQLLSQLEKLHMQRLQAPSNAQKTEVVDNAPHNALDNAPNNAPAKAAAAKAVSSTAKVQPLKPAVATNAPKLETKPVKPDLAAKVASNDDLGNATVTKRKTPAAKSVVSKTVSPVDTANSKLVSEADAKAIETIEESYLALVSKLTQGSWFEMDNGTQHYRCRLAAIIKATGKYIFVNRSGMKVAEESRETLAVAMKKGSLRLLDDTMLFDRALESVIGSLRQSRTN